MEERLIAQAAPQPELINNSSLSFLASLGGAKDMSKHNTDMFSAILSTLVNSDAKDSENFTLDTANASSNGRRDNEEENDISADITVETGTNDEYSQDENMYGDVSEASGLNEDIKNDDFSADKSLDDTKGVDAENKTNESTEQTNGNNDGSGEQEKAEAASQGVENTEKAVDKKEVVADKAPVEKGQVVKEKVTAAAKEALGNLVEAGKEKLVKVEAKKEIVSDSLGKTKTNGEAVNNVKSDLLTNKDGIGKTEGKEVKANIAVSEDGKIIVSDKNLKDETIKDSEVAGLVEKAKKINTQNSKENALVNSAAKGEGNKSEVVQDAQAALSKVNQEDSKEKLVSSDRLNKTIVKNEDNNKVVVETEKQDLGNQQQNTNQESLNLKEETKDAKVLTADKLPQAKEVNKNVTTELETQVEDSVNAAKSKVKGDNAFVNVITSADNKTAAGEQVQSAKSVDMLAGSKNVAGALGTTKASATEAKAAPQTSQTSYVSRADENKIIDQILSKAKINIKQNSKEMSLRLDPPELGKVNMKLSLSNNNILTAKIEVANDAVKASVTNNMATLRESLSQEGIKIDKFDVFVKDESQQQQQQQQGKNKTASSGSNDEEIIDINEIKEEVLAEVEAVAAKGKVNFLA